MSSEVATILMVDDHPLFRKGLKQLLELEDSLQIIGEFSRGQDALDMVKHSEPDLILLDLNMQGLDGIETLRMMRNQGVTARIIMLTVSDNEADVIQCIRAGADGYLLKDMEPEDILDKIKQAVLGKMVISERLAEVLATALRKPDQTDENLLASLTSREYEILMRIAQGYSNKTIARELGISDGTVKVHVKHLLKKLNMRSRVEAAVWVINKQKRS
ncbi:two-component system response regulator NarL [Zooshikella marina]|uniref:Two-component system response regulator NarL n=1 Tax=Zooshikella ganghwensis TaxID=202772 RepID=A0A4P9VIE6_9GAMM|nr:two-component system response regulator NarL [Zooshikella ganghwensis]MBU2705590.1 two-component system response regulator NarL [Zooshikella ganghwensis]RDH42995.1 two-component system response regulator NarL [Zooshikella ganghwensis]